MKNKSIFLAIICSVLLFFSAITATNFVFGQNPSPFTECESTAKAMCVLEQKSGRILYGKNINKKLPMASTTKVFTALTVLENVPNLDEKVAVDDRAVGIEGTSIYLRKGEVLTVKELLLGMLLPSGNDSATALAYYVGGDIPTFCRLMQKTAKKAGAYNSQFKNPHGLDEEGHYTTAYDLAIVSAKALENPTFFEISNTKTAVISGNTEVKSRYLKNKNRLLSNFDGCTGIKTGFTDSAGRCFVSSAERKGLHIVCSVLNSANMFEECAKFMELAFDDYQMIEVLPAYNLINGIEVKKGRENFVKVFSRKGFAYPLTKEEELCINYVIDLPEFLTAPVKKEEKVGTIKVYLKDKLLFEDDILTRDYVKKDSLLSYFKDVVKFWA